MADVFSTGKNRVSDEMIIKRAMQAKVHDETTVDVAVALYNDPKKKSYVAKVLRDMAEKFPNHREAWRIDDPQLPRGRKSAVTENYLTGLIAALQREQAATQTNGEQSA